jgi:polysaccharide deacetylase 2 family uncharacterized protein YibQ
MKKAITPKKTPRKTKKTASKAAKSPKKRVTTGADAIRAFILAWALVFFAAGISAAVIVIHSALKTPVRNILPDDELQIPVTFAPEPPKTYPQNVPSEAPPPVALSPPVISVSIQQPPVQDHRQPPKPVLPPAAPPERPVANAGTLVFIIDDAGNNLRELEPFLRIPEPLTIAVLPGLPYSAEAARRIRAAGKEVFLHQPMEAIGGQNPGPGAIYSGMSAGEVRALLRRNIEEIGPVTGINNHQGSKITMDKETMETVLSFCAEQGLCFLDSRTTADTVVPAVARRLGMHIGERDVFIDNEQDKAAMTGAITNGLARVQKKGSVVMIGHTWSGDLAPVLAERFPQLVRQGYSLKTASAIMLPER